MAELKPKKGESFDSFMRRVKQTWTRSGRLIQAKKVQYFEPKKSKNVERKQAVSYAGRLSKEAYLRKIGRLAPEDPKKRKFSRR